MKQLLLIIFAICFVGYLSSCDSDDEAIDPPLTGEDEEFALYGPEGSGIVGEVRFAKREDEAVLVEVILDGTGSGNFPAHIHTGTVSERGDVLITLNPAVGNGLSKTVVTETDDGEMITYEELISMEGYVDVHATDNPENLIVAGDLGENRLTGNRMLYNIYGDNEGENPAIITISERANGSALLEIDYEEEVDSPLPVVIERGTAANPAGSSAITLNDVGVNGRSVNNISEDDDGNPITYDELINYDGHINIYQDDENDVILSQGDIGANAFTGNVSDEYVINEVEESGIAGNLTLYERFDGTFLAVVELGGVTTGSVHPVTIASNSASEEGDVVITLSNAQSGLSLTEVDEFDDATPVSFDEIEAFDGHIRIHKSAEDMTVVASGDIGSNN